MTGTPPGQVSRGGRQRRRKNAFARRSGPNEPGTLSWSRLTEVLVADQLPSSGAKMQEKDQ